MPYVFVKKSMNKQLINTKRAKYYAGSFFAFSYRQACQLFVSPPAHGKRALTHMNFAAATIRNTILPKSSMRSFSRNVKATAAFTAFTK